MDIYHRSSLYYHCRNSLHHDWSRGGRGLGDGGYCSGSGNVYGKRGVGKCEGVYSGGHGYLRGGGGGCGGCGGDGRRDAEDMEVEAVVDTDVEDARVDIVVMKVPLQPKEQESLGSHSSIISQYAAQHYLYPDQSLQDHTDTVVNIGIHIPTDHQNLDHNTPDHNNTPPNHESPIHSTPDHHNNHTNHDSHIHNTPENPIQPLILGVSSPALRYLPENCKKP
ncbi:hypothetical protein Bca101_041598 [Brassica carinata]